MCTRLRCVDHKVKTDIGIPTKLINFKENINKNNNTHRSKNECNRGERDECSIENASKEEKKTYKIENRG